MQSRRYDVSANNDASNTLSNPYMATVGNSMPVGEDGMHHNETSPQTPNLFRKSHSKTGAFNSHGIPSSDADKGLAFTKDTSRSLAADRNELGMISDLIKLGLPRNNIGDDPKQNVLNSYKGEDRHLLDRDSGIVKTDINISDADNSSGLNPAGKNQVRYQNGSLRNGAVIKGEQPHVSEKLTPQLIDGNHMTHLSHQNMDTRKHDEKIKKKTSTTSSKSNDQNLEQITSSKSKSRHDVTNRIEPTNETSKQRVRNDSHPGNSKLTSYKSKPGVMSDDEYITHTSSSHRYGRRSAPIFTKRGFSSSEFLTSGQTTIEKTHKQDIANARIQATSPTENIILKFPGKRNSLLPNLRRPHSVGPGNFFSKQKRHRVNTEPAESDITAQGRGRGTASTYGSTSDTGRSVDHRGYHSEIETGDWRLHEGQPQLKAGLQPDGRLEWNIEFGGSPSLQDGTTFDKPAQDSLDTARARGMKGVFRTPSTFSPRDFQAKITRGKDAAALSNKSYGKIMENESPEFHKQSYALTSDDESITEEDSDDDEDEKKKISLGTISVDEYEEKRDIKLETRTEVYKRRWYLLALFSITAMLWNAIWSTWGPIAQSAKLVYNWDDGDIAMFTYLGNIPFLITMFPCAYFMDVSGMRTAMIFCCGFMFAGTGFRCIPGNINTSTWLIRTGQFLNGMAGTIPSSGPALLSGLWFPPNQRATATAISTVAGYFGASISFVIGPLLVPEPIDESPQINGSDSLFSFEDYDDDTNSSSNTTSYYSQEQGIKSILYGECVLAGLLLLLVLAYFPSKPPLPPSISASIPREKYLNGLKLLVRNKQFWICAIAFSVPIGVYESWQVILDINLDSKGISQQTAGWLDFYATVGGCLSGLLVSRFADLFIRQMKLFLLVFYTLATVAILWLTLVVLDIIPFDEVSLFAAIIIAGVFLDGGSPLFFELTIEVSYPVGEGVTSGFTHMMLAAAGTVFLIIVQVKNIGTDWMNWCFLGCVAMTIPLLLFIDTTYHRADIDDMEIDISEDEEAVTGIGASDNNEKTSLLKNSSV